MQRTIQSERIPESINSLRDYFNTHQTYSYEFRLQQLKQLKKFLIECEYLIIDALSKDLAKPAVESKMMEINVVSNDLDLAIRELSLWMRPKSIPTMFAIQPASAYQYAEPLGVVLIISPWNYPLQLALLPMVGAFAAGNTVLLKPSEMANNTSRLLAEYLPKYLNNNVLKVIEGGAEETQEILKHKFDHIFFTGSLPVGRKILQAAAMNLTPVTLELGGKSPCIVTEDADLDIAALRIAWGKFTNAGQTCIAPDYLLVHESIKEKLLNKLKYYIIYMYGEDAQQGDGYARIINHKHVLRLKNSIDRFNNIFYGGRVDESDKFIQPTIIDNVDFSDPIMHEDNEIFGPILPVISYSKMDQVVNEINARPKPLTLYLFSQSKALKNFIKMHTSSGSLVFNHVLLQAGLSNLPFGGVGASGMGRYHGKDSFELFSNKKSVLDKGDSLFLPDFSKVVQPPYTDFKSSLINAGIKTKLI